MLRYARPVRVVVMSAAGVVATWAALAVLGQSIEIYRRLDVVRHYQKKPERSAAA